MCNFDWIILIGFNFSRVLQPSREKLKTMLVQNVWGQISCIMGDAQVANYCCRRE